MKNKVDKKNYIRHVMAGLTRHLQQQEKRAKNRLIAGIKNNKMKNSIPLLALAIAAWACNTAQDNNPPYVPPRQEVSLDKIDKYLYDNNKKSILERYGTVIRYRFDNRMKGLEEDVSPVRKNVIIPTTQLLEYLAIQTYQKSYANPALGDQIVDALLPLEINYLGSAAFEKGQAIPKAAHAGQFAMNLYGLNATFTDEGEIVLAAAQGLTKIMHHELVHIANSKYGFPEKYETTSPRYNGTKAMGIGRVDAIELGMVSPYATTNKMEDIAELVAYYIKMKPSDFSECYLNTVVCNPTQTQSHKCKGLYLTLFDPTKTNIKTPYEHCKALNEGKRRIAIKLGLTKQFYETELKVNLDTLRKITQQRLNDPKLLENIKKQ